MKTSTKETTRPLAERITQGPVEELEIQVNHARLTPHGTPTVQVFDGNRENVAVFVELPHGELFHEAFTVCHETKRTPRQLADERAELLEALSLLWDFIGDLGDSNPGFLGKLCLQDYGRMNQAYLKTERILTRLRP